MCIPRLDPSSFFLTNEKQNWTVVAIDGRYYNDLNETIDLAGCVSNFDAKDSWCFIPQRPNFHPLLWEKHFPLLVRLFPHYSGQQQSQWYAVGLMTAPAKEEEKDSVFFHHGVNTIATSSGSPIMSLDGNLIGLHLGSLNNVDEFCSTKSIKIGAIIESLLKLSK